jgi:ribonuclease P protein component
MLPHGLQARERLRHPSDFRRVKERGKRYRTRHFLINSVGSQFPHHRLGMVVQKRFWNAVKRNRIKRCLREFFRHNKGHLGLSPQDVVIVALPGAEQLHPTKIAAELLEVLAKKEERSSC